jgi:hypothetical protein
MLQNWASCFIQEGGGGGGDSSRVGLLEVGYWMQDMVRSKYICIFITFCPNGDCY